MRGPATIRSGATLERARMAGLHNVDARASHAWVNGFVYLSAAIVILHMLICRATPLYRWDTHHQAPEVTLTAGSSYLGIRTVSMSSTVAFAVGIPPQTMFAESFTLKASPDEQRVPAGRRGCAGSLRGRQLLRPVLPLVGGHGHVDPHAHSRGRVLGQAGEGRRLVQVRLGGVEIVQVDAGPGRDGRVLGGERVQGPSYALAGVALLESEDLGPPFEGRGRQARVTAPAVVRLDEQIHTGRGAGHIGHTH